MPSLGANEKEKCVWEDVTERASRGAGARASARDRGHERRWATVVGHGAVRQGPVCGCPYPTRRVMCVMGPWVGGGRM